MRLEDFLVIHFLTWHMAADVANSLLFCTCSILARSCSPPLLGRDSSLAFIVMLWGMLQEEGRWAKYVKGVKRYKLPVTKNK